MTRGPFSGDVPVLLNHLRCLSRCLLTGFNHPDATLSGVLFFLRPLLDSLHFFFDRQVFADKTKLQFADAQSVMALRVVGVLAAAALFKTYSSGSNAFIYFQF